MKVIESGNTYAIRKDEKGEIVEAIYIPEGTSVISNSENIHVDDLTTDEIDFVINHAAENPIPDDILIFESGARSKSSDDAVNKLISEGKIIITQK